MWLPSWSSITAIRQTGVSKASVTKEPYGMVRLLVQDGVVLLDDHVLT